MTNDFEETALRQLIDQVDPDVRDAVLDDLRELGKSGVNSWQDLVAVLELPSMAQGRTKVCWLLTCELSPNC
jgi:hypothetical protein